MLLETLLENKRRGNFIRIYPAQGSHIYDPYFELSKNNNKFLYQCLYGKALFAEGSDPGRIVRPKTFLSTSKGSKGKSQAAAKAGLVVDSDVLVEYMERLASYAKSVLPDEFKQEWRRCILNFVNSSMWKKPLAFNQQ